MIWSTVVFNPGTDVLRAVVRALCEMPEPLRATRHRLGEDKVAQAIGDVGRFVGSLSADELAPMLRAKGADFDISAPGDKPVKCTCQFKARGIPLVRCFMERMAALKPVFGFAAPWDEYRHRNQLDVRLRPYRVQEFVGRDLLKCVPGLYWITLLPDALAERHGVPLAEVERAALNRYSLDGGQRLFEFHDHPDSWRERVDELDGLCATLPGIFNIADLRARLVGVTEEKEYEAIVDPWR